ncbi:MAG TPA: aminoacyl-tRNA hydrolase [Candidatus Norongarragalinales archaeon]|nr:aminoacyl-tRNA hydrolase [Candidatus Norongarragalinales archaeon]
MLKQAIVIRADLEMGKGKIAAQASHASVEGYIETAVRDPGKAEEWWHEGQKKIVLKVKSERELAELKRLAKDKGLLAIIIRDAGHTQIKAGTATALVIGPDEEGRLDAVTGKLKLL